MLVVSVRFYNLGSVTSATLAGVRAQVDWIVQEVDWRFLDYAEIPLTFPVGSTDTYQGLSWRRGKLSQSTDFTCHFVEDFI